MLAKVWTERYVPGVFEWVGREPLRLDSGWVGGRNSLEARDSRIDAVRVTREESVISPECSTAHHRSVRGPGLRPVGWCRSRVGQVCFFLATIAGFSSLGPSGRASALALDDRPGLAIEVGLPESVSQVWKLPFSDDFVLAGTPSADRVAALHRDGLEAIVDFRLPEETPDLDLEVLSASLKLDYTPPPLSISKTLTDQLLDELRDTLRRQSHRRTLLYCASSEHLATIWLACRVLDDGASWDDVIAEARQRGLHRESVEKRMLSYVSNPFRVRWAQLKKRIRAKFPDVAQVSVDEFSRQLERGAEAPLLLDVRQREEFEVSHLASAARAVNLKEALALLDGEPRDRAVVLYCSVGYRSARLSSALQDVGFSNVRNLEGSIFEWANRGNPVYREEAGESELVHEVHPYDQNWGELLEREFWFRSK